MTFHEYENEIRDTLAKYIRDRVEYERYTELALGLYEEGAEVTSIIRRTIPGNFHEKTIDIPHLEEEIGDVLWYISHIGMQFGRENLEEIATSNLQKNNPQDSLKSKSLSMQEYQKNVVTTYQKDIDLPRTQIERGRYFLMGLIKEIGEISTLFGNSWIERQLLDNIRVQEKLGDSLWYLTAIANNYGLDLETIALKNIQKTKGRYDKSGIAKIPAKEEGR